MSPQPHSSYYSGLSGPQHPFYNRPFFAPYLYTPRYYPGGSQHLISRSSVKTSLPRDQNNGLASVPATGTSLLLSSMTVDIVCEKLRQIEGLDQGMLPQYCTTIKKANINGRVLAQCNIDELKKEMAMNFGDWHLFRSMVLEMRSVENQVVPEDPRFLNENSSAPVAHGESARRTSHSELPHTELSSQTPYTLNFSFEELNTLGLDEGAPRHSNLSWQEENAAPVLDRQRFRRSSLN